MNKMTRSDIMTAAMDAGICYEDAEDISYILSPECQTVPESTVIRTIRKYKGE